MQNHRTEQELGEFSKTMERTVMPRVACALAVFGVIVAIYALDQAYGEHVAIAATLGLAPFLLIVAGFVMARGRKPDA